MTTLELSPTRGTPDTVFTFTIKDAPLIEVPRPPYKAENKCVFYLEAPDGTVLSQEIHRKDVTVRVKVSDWWNPVPLPVVPGWNRWVCFLFDAVTLGRPGADVTGTPLASCVMVLEPVE